MPKYGVEAIGTLVRQRIQTLQQPLQFSEERVVRIVRNNLARGRLERFAGNSSPAPSTLGNYIDRILSYVCLEQSRILALEIGDRGAWLQLRDYLMRRASRMFERLSHREPTGLAADMANQVCLIVFEEPFPFDVAFEAWITVILKNLILARLTRSTDALDRKHRIDSLDVFRKSEGGEAVALSDLVGDDKSLAQFEKADNRIILQQAIEHLPSAPQRLVIQYSFLDQLDDDEIARRLGKSKQAVYNLRQRALVRLKEILSPSSQSAHDH
jgi:RNA polymerase sigma factor (sigma-70 family)